MHDALVSRGSSYFLGPLICIVSPVKHGIPRERVCTLEYLCLQDVYVNEKSQQAVIDDTDRLALNINCDENFFCQSFF